MNNVRPDSDAPGTRFFLTLSRAQELFVRTDAPSLPPLSLEPGTYELERRTVPFAGEPRPWYCLRGSNLGAPANLLDWAVNPDAPGVGSPSGARVRPDASQYRFERLAPAEVEARVASLRSTAEGTMAQARRLRGFDAQTVYRLACDAYERLSAYVPLDHREGMVVRLAAVRAAHRAGWADFAWLRERFCREGMTAEQFATIVGALMTRTFFTIAANLDVTVFIDGVPTGETRALPPGTYELDEAVNVRDRTSGQWRFLRGRNDLAVSVAITGMLTSGTPLTVIGEKVFDIAACGAKLEELTPTQVSERVIQLLARASGLAVRAYNLRFREGEGALVRKRVCREAKEAFATIAAYAPYGTELGTSVRVNAITMALNEGRYEEVVIPLGERLCAEPEMSLAEFNRLVLEQAHSETD